MLRSAKSLYGYRVRAEDGDIGKVHEFLFDDAEWTVRYLVVDTGARLSGRNVLISTVALGRPDADSRGLPVALTRAQVENSPEMDTDSPVTLQYQIDLHNYYGWPTYWTYGGYYNVAPPPPEPWEEEQALGAEINPHLHGTREVAGYHLQAIDGEIGHVDDFIADDEAWDIRYIEVDTRNWIPGRKVLIPAEWISEASWVEQLVYADLSRDAVKHSPEYDPSAPIDREYESRLYGYYGRPRDRVRRSGNTVKVIGAIGKNGSGKDELISYLHRRCGIPVLSTGDIARDIARESDLPPTRETLHDISSRYIARYGIDYFPKLIIEKIEEMRPGIAGITGLRTPVDIMTLKERFGDDFILVHVKTSDPMLRFERLKRRGEPRDPVTYEEFLGQEEAEEALFKIEDAAKYADITILNDGSTDDFHRRIEESLVRQVLAEQNICE